MVTITKGGIYANISDTIFIDTSEPVTIDRCFITGTVCVSNVWGNRYGPPVNLTIRDSRFISNAAANPGNNSTTLCYFLGVNSLIIWNTYFSGQVQNKTALCAGGLVAQSGNQSSANPSITIVNSVFQDCSPAIQISGFKNNRSIGIYGNQVLETADFEHNDRISIFETNGVAGGMVMIQNNLVACNPDAREVVNAGGIVPDAGSAYIHVLGNRILNQGTGAYYDSGNTNLFEDNIIAGLGNDAAYGYALAIWPGGGFARNNTVLWVPGKSGGQPYYLGNAGPGDNPAPDGNDSIGDTGQITLPASQLTKQFLEDIYNDWLTNQLVGGVVYPSKLK